MRLLRLAAIYRLFVPNSIFISFKYLVATGGKKNCTTCFSRNPTMIYQRNFIEELTLTAIGIFCRVIGDFGFLYSLINLLGVLPMEVAIDAVAALIGFWTLGIDPLLLVF